jgi:hypothetical protein
MQAPGVTVEDQMIDIATDPGVEHLLRIARAQCDASLAFAAVRDETGKITVVTYPPTDEGTYWSLDGLRGIAENTWDDPLLGRGGRAVLRVNMPPKRLIRVPGQHSRLAVATLGSVVHPELPWGLLCALEPLSGQFTDEHLDVLGNLALRLNNYLRARQSVADGEKREAATLDWDEADLDEAYDAALKAEKQQDEPETKDKESAVFVPDDVSRPRIGKDVIVEIQRVPVHEAAEGAGAQPKAPNVSTAGPAREPAIPVGLHDFLARVEAAIAELSVADDVGAVILLNVAGASSPVGEAEAVALSSRLLAHTRYEDSVARVGGATFGVFLKLRRAVGDPAAIRLRLEEWVRQSLPSGPSSHEVRSCMVLVDPKESPRAEDIFLRAISQLGVL